MSKAVVITPAEAIDEFIELYERVRDYWVEVFPPAGRTSFKVLCLAVTPDELECAYRRMIGVIANTGQWGALRDVLRSQVASICPVTQWRREGRYDTIESADVRQPGLHLLYLFCEAIEFGLLRKVGLGYVLRSFTECRTFLGAPEYTQPTTCRLPSRSTTTPPAPTVNIWTFSCKSEYQDRLAKVLTFALDNSIIVRSGGSQSYEWGERTLVDIAQFVACACKLLRIVAPSRDKRQTYWAVWANSISAPWSASDDLARTLRQAYQRGKGSSDFACLLAKLSRSVGD